MTSDNLRELCKSMPKVELHAHLNGCISDEILERVSELDETKNNVPSDLMASRNTRSGRRRSLDLAVCFSTFAKIHEVIKTPKILHWVTNQVIEDFSADNVVYLEIRTTPKRIHEIPSKDVYMESVVDAIIDSQKRLPIVVKLLVSVDRKLSVSEAEENVTLAMNWSNKFPDVVVGMDLSGDPTKGTFESLIPALKRAKDFGLKLTLHLPEVVNVQEAEQMLLFRPHRVGHAVNIHPESGGTQKLWETLLASGIPVEVCLTSNVMSKCSTSIDDHHIKHLLDSNIPFTICTDDSGVFRTTSSNEYELAATTLSLSNDQLRALSVKSVGYSFGSSQEKEAVVASVCQWWENYLH